MSQRAERPPIADLRARVLAEVARTPSMTRATYKRRVMVIAAVGTLATFALFMAMGGPARGARPVELVAFTAGFGLFAAAVLMRLALGQSDSMLGRPRAVLLSAVVVAAPVLALVALATTLVWPGPTSEEVGTGAHLACGSMGVVQGLLPLLVLLVPKRGSDPVHPAITGAALGMTAGAWSVVMAYLRCPHAAAMHCVLAHVAPTLVLTALGAGLGWLLLRVK